ncbi:MAG: transcription elongation factor GreB [Gammaproteobacteria bacterium]|nr:transcription elongation factor GreB [Gammaproteobacteria bacterium]
MIRYRPPQKSGAKYITSEGERKLKEELHELWKVERPKVTASVSEAAALGDRSENAEYIYGKKRLREIDRRIGYLSKRLEELIVVSTPPDNTGKVYFGAFVTLEKEDGNIMTYRIVGPDEIDPKKGYISIDSPLGMELLGKYEDTELAIRSPSGKQHYRIIDIDYEEP